MDFSVIGFLIGTSILLPNLLILVIPPKNVPKGLKDAGILFTVLERIGQVGCLVLLAISQNNYQNTSINIWSILMVLCIIVYYSLWIRYVVEGHDFAMCFKPLAFIPVPMAIFPIFAFGFAAIWGKSIYLGISVVLFAIGHLRNSWHTYQLTK